MDRIDCWNLTEADLCPLAHELADHRLDSAPSTATLQRYHAVLDRLARSGDTVASAATQADYDERRAAVTAIAAQAIHASLHQGGASLRGDADPDAVRHALNILLLYPPTGDTPPDGALSDRSNLPRRDGDPYRAAARRVVRSPRFRRGELWTNCPADPNAAAAFAVLYITGLRPIELEMGVHLTLPGDGCLGFTINGAKHNDARDSGYPWRCPVFAIDTPEIQYLADRMEGAAAWTFAYPRDALATTVGEIAWRTFDRRLAPEVKPYVFRHIAAGRMRAKVGWAEAAKALGHRSIRSTRGYAGARSGGPAPDVVLVPDPAPVVDATPVADPAPAPEPPMPR